MNKKVWLRTGIILIAVIAAVVLLYRQSRKLLVPDCPANLRAIRNAKMQAAVEFDLPNGSPVKPEQILNAFTNGIPKCPKGGNYSINPIGQLPTCSIPEHRIIN